MNKIIIGVLLAVFCLAGTSWSADFSLLINDTSVQGAFSTALDQNEFGESVLAGRLLYNDDKETVFGSVGAGVNGVPGNVDGLKVGAQVIGNLGRTDSEDLLAFGLGLLASYQPPPLQGVGVHGRAQYAPKLLSFADCNRLWEAAVGVSYMFTPKATLLLEFQKIKVDLENRGQRSADESVRLGLQFYF